MTTVFKEAWTTVVPGSEERHGPLAPLLLALTVVTGLVDAFSYLSLGHVFVANMTGNVIFMAFSVAGAPGFSLVASAVALVSFAAGALAGGRIGHGTAHRGQLLLRAAVVQLVLVGVALGWSYLASSPYTGAGTYVLIVALGLAMGVQNAAARRLAVPDLTTTVLTLTITGISADGRLAGGPGSRAGRRLLSAAAMFLGGLAGALLVVHHMPAVPLAVATGILAAIVVATTVLSRSTAHWTRHV